MSSTSFVNRLQVSRVRAVSLKNHSRNRDPINSRGRACLYTRSHLGSHPPARDCILNIRGEHGRANKGRRIRGTNERGGGLIRDGLGWGYIREPARDGKKREVTLGESRSSRATKS